MFDSPGLITATAATEKGTPQAAPRSTFVPPKRNTRMSPRFRVASAGQFEARTTSFAFFDFAARRTSRRPKRTSPVSVATRRARGTSITGRPPPRAPQGPAPGAEASPRFGLRHGGRFRESGRRLVNQVHRTRAEGDGLAHDHVLRDAVQVVHLARDRRTEQVMGRDLERGAGEDGGLAAGDAVAADRLHVAIVRHHVGDQHDVADVDREALLLERVVRLVHDGVARGLDPEDLVDLLNRVRAGPRGVDVREFEDLREVRSLRVDDVSIAALPDDRA